jgi:hypothetical protein
MALTAKTPLPWIGERRAAMRRTEVMGESAGSGEWSRDDARCGASWEFPPTLLRFKQSFEVKP